MMDVTKCHGGGLDVSSACPAGGGACQHHGAEYAEWGAPSGSTFLSSTYASIANAATIVQVSITTTERCCITIMSSISLPSGFNPTDFEIERPSGTIRTTQEDSIATGDVEMMHHGAWEVLDAGTYTYYLINRAGSARVMYSAWIKAVASDCEG